MPSKYTPYLKCRTRKYAVAMQVVYLTCALPKLPPALKFPTTRQHALIPGRANTVLTSARNTNPQREGSPMLNLFRKSKQN